MNKSNRDRDARPTSVTSKQVRALQVDLKLGGVSMQKAMDAVCALAKAAAKVSLPEGEELRTVLLRAWRRDYGALRFCYPRWWSVYLRGTGK